MTEPRKHHFLPKFYLRGFTEDDKTIIQFEKTTGRNYGVSINDAAAIRDYHELDHEDFVDPNALEKELAKIESLLSQNLSNVIRAGIVGTESNMRLAELVALLRVRVPTFKNYIENSLREIVRSTGKIMDRKGALPPRPKGYEDESTFDKMNIEISNWKCLEFMFMLAADPDLIKIFIEMRPTILRAPMGTNFITGDQPVAVYSPVASQEDVYGFGLIDKRTEVTLPLSKDTIVRYDWADGDSGERIATAEEVEEYNRRTIVMAEQLVFASSCNVEINNSIAKYSHCFAGIDLNTLDLGLSAYHISRFKPVMKEDKYKYTA
jgi:hypothetical protein